MYYSGNPSDLGMTAGENVPIDDSVKELSSSMAEGAKFSNYSRHVFTPYTHPISYTLRMATFTRARAMINAGMGGLYLGKFFRPFTALAIGATSPGWAAFYGTMAGISTGPPTLGSFLMRSYLFTRFIGVRKAAGAEGLGGGFAGILRLFGFDKAAEAIEAKMGRTNFLLTGKLFGELPRYGMFIPKANKYARLLGYTKAAHEFTATIPALDLTALTRSTKFRGLTEELGKLYKIKRELGAYRGGPLRRFRRRLVELVPGIPEYGITMRELKDITEATIKSKKAALYDVIASKVSMLPLGTAAEERKLYGLIKAGKMEEAMSFYKEAAGKYWSSIANKIGPRAFGPKFPFARNRVLGMEEFLGNIVGAVGMDRKGGVLRGLFSKRSGLALAELYKETAMGSVFWGRFRQANTFLGLFQNPLWGEFKLMFKGYRNRLFTGILKDINRISAELGNFAEGRVAISAEKLANLKLGGGEVLGRERAANIIEFLKKKKIITGGEGGVYRFRKGIIKSGEEILSAQEKIKLATEGMEKIVSTTASKAFSTYLWLSLGVHYGKKAVGALINAAAVGIKKGAELSLSVGHLEFGNGKSVFTRQASTERTRALQAIQYSGLNARSYLGRESQIYAQ